MDGIPFSYTWWGHIFTGSCVGAVILILNGAISWTLDVPMPLGSALLTVALSVVVAETLSTIVERWNSNRVGHPDPGGWIPSIVIVLQYCAIYPLVALLVAGKDASAVMLLASLAVTIPYVLWMRPWQKGMSRQESRERRRAMKEMEQEEFGAGNG